MTQTTKWWGFGSRTNDTACCAAKKSKKGAAQLGDKASGVMHHVAQSAEDWKHSAQDRLSGLREAASTYVDQGRKTVASVGDMVGEQVRQRPAMSVLLAVGAGCLLGAFLLAFGETDSKTVKTADAKA